MKKLMKYFSLCMISIMLFTTTVFVGKPMTVKADGGTLEVALPTNYISIYTLYKTYTFREMLQFETILDIFEDDDNHDSYLNEDGKSVFYETSQDDKMAFKLYEGATEDDCIYTISDELREEIIGDFGLDIYKGYDKIQIRFVEVPDAEFNGYITFDFAAYDSTLDMDLFTFFMLEDSDILDLFFNTNNMRYFDDINGKTLMTREYVDDDVKYRFNVPDDVTVEDDIIYTFVDGDRDYILSEYGRDIDGYSRLVMKFSDAEYNDPTDLVYDFSTLSDNSYWKYGDVWEFAADKGFVTPYYNRYESYDGERFMFSLNELADGYLTVEINEELTYEDNMVIEDLDDEFIAEFMDEYGFEVQGVIFIFKNPIFIDGEDQEYNPESGEALSFRLNIEFDKFLESGVVYLDDEEVDPENYEATEGSTIITFKDDFVAGLDEGDHTVKVTVMDGYATANFKIVSETADEEKPATGDNLFLFMSMLLMSAGGLYVVRKRLD